ncbi:MAG: hypothetical protein LBS97_01300 [Treponema sp.]|jgi:hypothetical protein|nr:hypothetical protein [Treponema sp.]
MKITQYALILVALCCFSCRDVVNLERPEDYSNAGASTVAVTWSSVFESYWTGMNNNYLFWNIDPTDWDGVYNSYKPKFAALDVTKNVDFLTAYRYFQNITKDLVDGHYTLTISDLYGNTKYLDPSVARYYQKHGLNLYEYFDSGGNTSLLEKSPSFIHSDWWVERFSTPELRSAVESRFTGNGGEYHAAAIGDRNDYGINSSNFAMATGSLPVSGGRILYFQFTGFNYYDITYCYAVRKDLYMKIDAANTAGKSDGELLTDPDLDPEWRLALEIRDVMRKTLQFFDDLKKPDVKGVVIDLRGNGGGAILDLSFIWGRMINQELTFAYTRSKLGDNRLDYTPWLPYKVFPAPDGVALMVPIVALVNIQSASCSETSAMIAAALPNGYVVGGTTYGAQGGIADNRKYNGGQFTAPLLKLVYTPSLQVKYLDGKIYEGEGFPPDIPVEFDYDALQAGTDTRLEAAINCVLEHQ